MPWVVSTECNFTDDERRQRLYSGEVFCIPPRETVKALTNFAFDMIADAFGSHDPLTAHNELPRRGLRQDPQDAKARVHTSSEVEGAAARHLGRPWSRSDEDILRCSKAAGRPTVCIFVRWARLQLQTSSRHLVLRATVPEQLVDTNRGQLRGDRYAVSS